MATLLDRLAKQAVLFIKKFTKLVGLYLSMKNVKFLPVILLSTYALAEEITAQTIERMVDPILPSFSLKAQEIRAKEMARSSEEERINAERFIYAKNRIQQELGDKPLLLAEATIKIYADNGFMPMWSDEEAVKLFLREYALFVASGVSEKSAKSLQHILDTQDGLARDILLTDSFLDYLYYDTNVRDNAERWLYRLAGYTPKAPYQDQIKLWEIAVKGDSAVQFVRNRVPTNHLYQETAEKLLAFVQNGHFVEKSDANKQALAALAIDSRTFAKLALNLQRLRLIPSFDNGIFVNIPSYQLDYMRDGKLVLQSKVIVGRDDRRTPIMYSKLSNVVVNPPWNVPPTIKALDLVPKFSRNPSLIESSGYEILDSKGKQIDPYTIDWTQYEGKAKAFPYHIRQKPGDNAALGQYKFNMPSSDAIYLHDTPNRRLFGKGNRALSSGCVRVAKSDELATLLLKEAGWSNEKKQQVLASRKTTSASIHSDNPVYLYYVTVWADGGEWHTLPDIYKYDAKIPNVLFELERVKNVI